MRLTKNKIRLALAAPSTAVAEVGDKLISKIDSPTEFVVNLKSSL